MSGISISSNADAIKKMEIAVQSTSAVSQVDELNIMVSGNQGVGNTAEYTISAEAQYVFEMQNYFYALDDAGRDQAIDFFTKGDTELHQRMADIYRGLQAMENERREGRGIVFADDTEFWKAHRPLDTNLVIDGKNEIGVLPNNPVVFQLEEKPLFPLSTGSGYYTELHKYLKELWNTTGSLFRNRDAANLFGSISNALYASENVFFSADHVLHYNYTIEQARKTIEFVNPPAELKTVLNDLLDRGVAWQNTKQSNSIIHNRKMTSYSRVSGAAADAVRLGTAAQAFNQKLLTVLKSPTASLLTSESLIMRELVNQPDLIRFNPDKVREALDFYRKEDSLYDQALNRPSVLPTTRYVGPMFEINQKLFSASKQYALKVIGEIEGYAVSKSKLTDA